MDDGLERYLEVEKERTNIVDALAVEAEDLNLDILIDEGDEEMVDDREDGDVAADDKFRGESLNAARRVLGSKSLEVGSSDRSYLEEALSEVEGKSREEIVKLINVKLGGKGTGMYSDIQEHRKTVWGQGTSCHILSSWATLWGTVAELMVDGKWER